MTSFTDVIDSQSRNGCMIAAAEMKLGYRMGQTGRGMLRTDGGQ